jgi:MerR family transcriptional regulator, thiopeptide resistance regulator
MDRAQEGRRWTVGEVASLAHVSIRTLRHYDQIGLLVPSERSRARYRRYTATDLERLHQVLLYRELGFTLDAIGRMLDVPGRDRHAELVAQRALLVERRERTEAVIRAVDRTLDAMKEGIPMGTDQLFEDFDAFRDAPDDVRRQHAAHGEEARTRWGGSDAYVESMRRARRHSATDWANIKTEAEAQEEHMAWLLEAGASPEGAEARAGAEAMRQHITRWFYPCSTVMHVGLADMYVSDPRFAAHYDRRVTGLAAFVARAIRANAEAADKPSV